MRSISIDFDGVLNTYNGWNGDDELYQPQRGAKEFLEKLSLDYEVIIFTVRDKVKVEEWMRLHELPFATVTNIKQPSAAYIDDRAICFNGDYDEVLKVLEDFKPHWLK